MSLLWNITREYLLHLDHVIIPKWWASYYLMCIGIASGFLINKSNHPLFVFYSMPCMSKPKHILSYKDQYCFTVLIRAAKKLLVGLNGVSISYHFRSGETLLVPIEPLKSAFAYLKLPCDFPPEKQKLHRELKSKCMYTKLISK